ncbi:major capsid protein [Bradyrhizobium sp. HKCCYLS2038]|uniref:major capsid protein n=1 Tax=Bradyrhizobium sp. HKCCYLS2038 TaxID=3420764 RepID=UPI003EBF2ECB
MAIIGSSFPTLIDAHKGSAEGTVIEILNKQNPVLDDAIATQCNMDAVHRHMIRTGLPSVAWGRLYQGVPQSKATMQQVDDTTGFLEAASTVDSRLLAIAPDPAKQRLVDSAPFLEAMNQEMATGIFYHDTATTPEKFKGLAARYSLYNTNRPDPSKPNISNHVIHGGASGANNTSIWFVTWGDHATSLLYPKGTKAGVSIEDKGEQRILDALGNPFYAKETMFRWHIGAFVKDFRYNCRIANIDVPAMINGTVDIWALMRKAYYRLQSRRRDAESSRIAIYMNRDVLEILDAQSSDRALLAANPNYTGLKPMNVEGKEVQSYRGIPIRETDAILNNEALVGSIAI